jgi:TP901-1 family phage major tail protein
MTAQSGRDMLLKIGDGATPQVFTAVAGLRSRSLSLNARSIDVTDSDSVGRWRELLAGAGVRAVAISGSGIFRDAASDALVRTAFFSQTANSWQIIIPGFGLLEGAFLVTTLDYAADYDGEVRFSLALSSAGPVGFTAL